MKMTVIRNPEDGCKIWFCKAGDRCSVAILREFDEEYAPKLHTSRKELWATIEYQVSAHDGNNFFKAMIAEGFVVAEVSTK